MGAVCRGFFWFVLAWLESVNGALTCVGWFPLVSSLLPLFQFTSSPHGSVVVAFVGPLDVDVEIPLFHELLGGVEVVGMYSNLVFFVWTPLQILFHGEKDWRRCSCSG